MLDRIGGAEGDRTPDLMTASHALSQLSYGPLRNDTLPGISSPFEGFNLQEPLAHSQIDDAIGATLTVQRNKLTSESFPASPSKHFPPSSLRKLSPLITRNIS